MANFQIKLTPVDMFFFGGEKHNEELKTNYFVESLCYPQQTALLGLMRYYLLLKHNLIKNQKILKPDTAKELIGEESFDYNFNNIKQDFKAIKTISPLYFIDDKVNYFFAPLDLCFEIDNDYRLYMNNDKYNAKKHSKLIKQYIISENCKSFYPLSDIIKDVNRVGNDIDKIDTDVNKFFKQKMKIFKNENHKWSFAFDCDIDDKDKDKDKVKNETIFIPFGGEKCLFKMEIKQQNAVTFSYPVIHKRDNANSVYCISDCFLPNSALNYSNFAVNNIVSYRNFRSRIDTKNHNSLPKSKSISEGQIRSSRYNIIQRGSVFYFNDKEKLSKFINEIEKNQNCIQIGFNKYLTNKN